MTHEVQSGQMSLLPPAPGKCPACGFDHEPAMPHNRDALYYQYRFKMLRGRWPTWADAVAHCSEEMAEFWRQELVIAGAWSEPEEHEGPPIADPPAESFRQVIEVEVEAGWPEDPQ